MAGDFHSLYHDVVRKSKKAGGDWWNGFCPFHEGPNSKSPSFGWNESTGGFNCQGCNRTGSAVEFYGLINISTYSGTDQDKKDAFKELVKLIPAIGTPGFKANQKRDSGNAVAKSSLPTKEEIEKWHSDLLASPEKLDVLLNKRHWSLEEIKKRQVGIASFKEKDGEAFVDRERYSIPIYYGRRLKNVRKYIPGAKKPIVKIKGIFGRNENQCFPVEAFDSKTVFLVEGEPDCLAARSCGLNAMTFTGGAGKIPVDSESLFKDHKVVIIYDYDYGIDANGAVKTKGQVGAIQVAEKLKGHAESVRIMDIGPLVDVTLHEKDITDVIAKIGGIGLKRWIKKELPNVPVFQAKASDTSDAREVSFSSATSAENVSASHKISFSAIVMGAAQQPYDAISKLSATCEQAGSKDKCAYCPLALGKAVADLDLLSDDMLAQIRTTKGIKNKTLQRGAGFGCEAWRIDPQATERTSIHEVIIGPEIDRSIVDDDALGDGEMGINQRTVFVHINGQGPLQLNNSYRFEGVSVPQPWNQAVTHIFDVAKKVDSDVETFDLSEEEQESLRHWVEAIGGVNAEPTTERLEY